MNNSIEIIGILGFKGSGKDTAAQALIREYGFAKFAFADALKDTLAAMFCWDRDALEGVTPDSRKWRESVDEWWAKRLNIPHFTPRFAMTHVGTEVLRGHFHDDLWLANIERRIQLSNTQKVIITDCRFPNEAGMIRRMGGKFVRIFKGPVPTFWSVTGDASNHQKDRYERTRAFMAENHPDVHESEWGWNHVTVDCDILNNYGIGDLHSTMLQAYQGLYVQS